MYHLKGSDLKFYGPDLSTYPKNIFDENEEIIGTTYSDWQELEGKHINTGSVCYMCADRCDDWNLFVIVGKEMVCTEEGLNDDLGYDRSNTLKVVFPRIRMIDGKVVLGQDKSVPSVNETTIEHNKKCQLRNIRQGCCFTCDCGAEEKMISEYSESFISQENNEGLYKIYTLDLKKLPNLIYIGCQSLDTKSTNHLDQPIDLCYYKSGST